MGSTRNDVLKVGLDVLCFLIFAIPLWVYNLLNVVPLTRNGFFCSDLSIRYPYHSSTLSSAVLFVSGFAILFAAVLVVETLLYRRQQPVPSKSTFHPLLCNVYRAIGYAVIGGCVNQFLTDIGKQCVGRLRPHFYDLCQPSVACTTDNQYIYITNYTCTRTSHPLIPPHNFHERMLDSRKSFPSGHASFAFFMAIYVIAYLEFRLTAQRTRLVRHLAETGIAAWAVWICCSRVFDFKHRFSDVAAGILLGIMVASASFYFFLMSTRKTLPPKFPAKKDVESNGVSQRSKHPVVTPNGADSSLSNLNGVHTA